MTAATHLRSRCGATIQLEVDRWFSDVDEVERELLARLAEPILDLGCGPGRIVAELARSGRVALGVDLEPEAVGEARRRGGTALQRSLFSPLPGEGRWASVVLFDGNIGIGGSPVRLLRRVAELLASGGTALIEVGGPGSGSSELEVRVERGDSTGPWFAWALVDVDGIRGGLERAGLSTVAIESYGTRWFVTAVRR